MMKWFLGAAAVLAVAGSAAAQVASSGRFEPGRRDRIGSGEVISQLQRVRPAYIANLDRTIVIPLGEDSGFSPRGLETVYDNSTAPFFSTAGIPRTNTLDDGFFTPGPGAGGNFGVTQADVGFVVQGTPTFDMVVLFWDTLAAADPVNTGDLDGFVLGFADVADGAYFTDFIDLTGIFPDGLLIPDDDWGTQFAFVEPGTETLLPTPSATCLFAGSDHGDGTGGPAVGFSDDVYFRDTQPDGIFTAVTPNEARFFGGFPNLANFYMRLARGDAPPVCPPDFDGDGFLTGLDFDAFVLAFEAGDPSADYDENGFVNGDDFDAYVLDFEAGC